ncbi:MAG: glycosyltransferase family 2 protein, partial [Caldilinea sp.]
MNPQISADKIQHVRAWLTRFDEHTPAVVVPIFNAFDDVTECVDSLLANTESNAPILLIDDCSTDARIQQLGEFLASAYPSRLTYVRKDNNSGFVGSVNLAFEATHPRDVVVVNSDVILPPRWLERLHSAAYVRTNVATVTPFTNHGTMVSIPYRNRPSGDLPDGLSLSEVDARVERASLRQYPPIPTAIGHCTYFRRTVLDVIGYFDEAFAPGYGEEVDFSQRAVAHGFINIVADDLFVHHKGSRSFDAAGRLRREKIQIEHEKLIHERYPWYTAWMRAESNARYSPLADAISRARRSLLPVRVAIDATYLAPTTTGTSVVAIEMIRALASAPQRLGEMFVIVRNGATSAFKARVGDVVDGVYALDELEQMDAPTFDLVFRPAQVQRYEELMRLQTIAEKFVVFQLDFIAYANPAYASSY